MFISFSGTSKYLGVHLYSHFFNKMPSTSQNKKFDAPGMNQDISNNLIHASLYRGFLESNAASTIF